MTSRIASTVSFISISLIVIMSLGCTWEIRTGLEKHQFEIGDQSFAISLPSEFQQDSEVSFVQFLRPENRVARSLRFTAGLPTLNELPYKVSLRQGGTLRYDIVTYGGGSGGSEAELFGNIMFDITSIGNYRHGSR